MIHKHLSDDFGRAMSVRPITIWNRDRAGFSYLRTQPAWNAHMDQTRAELMANLERARQMIPK